MIRSICEAIQWFFELVLLNPLDGVRKLELESWFGANMINWVFSIIGFVAFMYWMKQIKLFKDDENDYDRPDVVAHTFFDNE